MVDPSHQKIKAVLDSLKPAEQTKLNELTETLRKRACVSTDYAKQFLGDALFQKVTAIGLFDISVVSNSTEDVGFLTLPSAFSKYSNSMVDDTFDLAKAFVSSVTYGMPLLGVLLYCHCDRLLHEGAFIP